MSTDEELHRNVTTICNTAQKLLHETQRLRRDIKILYKRIEPFEGEEIGGDPIPTTVPKNLRDAVEMISRARDGIRMAELDKHHAL